MDEVWVGKHIVAMRVGDYKLIFGAVGVDTVI
eukprot:COSAG05_NODE_19521_length_291_cov_0.927083_1_plen_31_part_01